MEIQNPGICHIQEFNSESIIDSYLLVKNTDIDIPHGTVSILFVGPFLVQDPGNFTYGSLALTFG
jgi:hypothetical protein